MVEAIVALKNVVPGIVSIEVGETFTHERSRGFTHLLSVRLDSRQRLAEYAAHPGEWPSRSCRKGSPYCAPAALRAEHLRVLEEHIKPIVDDVCALDAECPRCVGPARPASLLCKGAPCDTRLALPGTKSPGGRHRSQL